MVAKDDALKAKDDALNAKDNALNAKKDALAAKERALAAQREAERVSARMLLDLAAKRGEAGQVAQALHLLVKSLDMAIHVGDADLERAARVSLSAWRPYLVRKRATLMHPD
jgi:hypothetical protein